MRRFLNFLGAEDDLDGNPDPDDPLQLITTAEEKHLEAIASDEFLSTATRTSEQSVEQLQQLARHNNDIFTDEAADDEIQRNFSFGDKSQGDVGSSQLNPKLFLDDCEASNIPAKDISLESPERNTIEEFSPEKKLRDLVSLLRAFVGGKYIQIPPYFVGSDSTDNVSLEDSVVFALRLLAEVMVWADQNDPEVWDSFMEYAVMQLLVDTLHASKRAVSKVEQNLHATAEIEYENELSLPNEAKSGEVEVIDLAKVVDPVELDKQLDTAMSPPSNPGELESSSDTSNTPKVSIPRQNEETPVSVSRHPLPLQLTNLNSEDRETAANPNENGTGSEEKDEPVVLVSVQVQLLQTLSIIVQSVSRRESLFCLFASDHINRLLSFPFSFTDDEMVALFLSAVKSISLKLDSDLLQLFFNPDDNSFPLYIAVAKFYDHPESMVRIAVRNITLTICSLNDDHVLNYVSSDETGYISNTVQLLAKLCGSVARAFEIILDDGREIQRTRRRTGIFRRSVRPPDVSAKLAEIESLCAYLGEVASVANFRLCQVVFEQAGLKLFGRFFRPIASQASPEAIRQLRKWRLSNFETKPALTRYDAAARCVLLAFFLTICRRSPLGRSLVRSICRPAVEFEGRHVLHGLKAMLSDVTGTERVTFITLCTIEALIGCDAVTKRLLRLLKCDFGIGSSSHSSTDKSPVHEDSTLNIGIPGEDDLVYGGEEPLLMSLMEFEIPLTPLSSHESLPSLMSLSPRHEFGYYTSKESGLSSYDLSSQASPKSPFTPKSPGPELSDNERILASFSTGEASIREGISSLLLVGRRREVRSERVLQTVERIILLICARSENLDASIEVVKVILDELASAVLSAMKGRATTIVSIEKMFDNFRAVCTSNAVSQKSTLDKILSPDQLPISISQLPRRAGRRRGALVEKMELPIEEEDALAFFMILDVFEQLMERKTNWNKARLSEMVRDALTESGTDDSYLDKRDALERVGDIVLRHHGLE